MTKAERQERLKELIEADELTPNEILDLLVKESGVTERTVRSDFAELYPDVVLEKASTPTLDDNDTPNEEEPESTEPEGYQVPKGEENVFHVKIERVQFSAVDGSRLSKPTVQKYNKHAWAVAQPNMKSQGWTYEVLHDPTK